MCRGRISVLQSLRSAGARTRDRATERRNYKNLANLDRNRQQMIDHVSAAIWVALDRLRSPA